MDTLLTVLRNVTKEETVQYVLALLDEVITGKLTRPSRATATDSEIVHGVLCLIFAEVRCGVLPVSVIKFQP